MTDINEALANFKEMIRQVKEEGEEFTIFSDEIPVAVLLPVNHFQFAEMPEIDCYG